MATYLVYHAERREGDARRVLSERVRARWNANAVDIGGLWVLQADTTSDEIRDDLLRHCGAGQRLIIFALGPDAAWNGLAEAETSLLVQHIS